MSRGPLRVAVTVLLAVFVGVAVLTAPSPERDRAADIGARLRCPQCQGESIAESPAPIARDMMALVEELVAQGYSDRQVIDTVLDSYTGAVLLDPPRSGVTLLLWLTPLLGIIAGVAVVWGRRRRTSPPRARPATVLTREEQR